MFSIDAGEENGQRRSGLGIWDRGDYPITDALEAMLRIQKLPRAQQEGEWSKFAASHPGDTQRAYRGRVGDHSVGLRLMDRDGHDSLRLRVNPDKIAGYAVFGRQRERDEPVPAGHGRALGPAATFGALEPSAIPRNFGNTAEFCPADPLDPLSRSKNQDLRRSQKADEGVGSGPGGPPHDYLTSMLFSYDAASHRSTRASMAASAIAPSTPASPPSAGGTMYSAIRSRISGAWM